MDDKEYSPDNYRSLNVSIGAITKYPEILDSDQLKAKKDV